jgi:hypothetical protein
MENRFESLEIVRSDVTGTGTIRFDSSVRLYNLVHDRSRARAGDSESARPWRRHLGIRCADETCGEGFALAQYPVVGKNADVVLRLTGRRQRETGVPRVYCRG